MGRDILVGWVGWVAGRMRVGVRTCIETGGMRPREEEEVGGSRGAIVRRIQGTQRRRPSECWQKWEIRKLSDFHFNCNETVVQLVYANGPWLVDSSSLFS